MLASSYATRAKREPCARGSKVGFLLLDTSELVVRRLSRLCGGIAHCESTKSIENNIAIERYQYPFLNGIHVEIFFREPNLDSAWQRRDELRAVSFEPGIQETAASEMSKFNAFLGIGCNCFTLLAFLRKRGSAVRRSVSVLDIYQRTRTYARKMTAQSPVPPHTPPPGNRFIPLATHEQTFRTKSSTSCLRAPTLLISYHESEIRMTCREY